MKNASDSQRRATLGMEFLMIVQLGAIEQERKAKKNL